MQMGWEGPMSSTWHNLLCYILTSEQLFNDKEHWWLQASESTGSSGISSATRKLDPVSPTCDLHTVASLAASAGERYLVTVLGNRRWCEQFCFILSSRGYPTKLWFPSPCHSAWHHHVSYSWFLSFRFILLCHVQKLYFVAHCPSSRHDAPPAPSSVVFHTF